MRVDVLPDGGLDTLGLEWFLNKAVASNQWLMTTQWFFSDRPDDDEHGPTVPVLVPEDVAVKLLLSDLEGPIQRIGDDHPVLSVEARRWHWAAFVAEPNDQGIGRFPWETVDA